MMRHPTAALPSSTVSVVTTLAFAKYRPVCLSCLSLSLLLSLCGCACASVSDAVSVSACPCAYACLAVCLWSVSWSVMESVMSLRNVFGVAFVASCAQLCNCHAVCTSMCGHTYAQARARAGTTESCRGACACCSAPTHPDTTSDSSPTLPLPLFHPPFLADPAQPQCGCGARARIWCAHGTGRLHRSHGC